MVEPLMEPLKEPDIIIVEPVEKLPDRLMYAPFSV
jgi:hypothetical protein